MNNIIDCIYNHLKYDWYGMGKRPIATLDKGQLEDIVDKFFTEKIDYILLQLFPAEYHDNRPPHQGYRIIMLEVQGRTFELKVYTPIEDINNLESKLKRAVAVNDTIGSNLHIEANAEIDRLLEQLKKDINKYRTEVKARFSNSETCSM